MQEMKLLPSQLSCSQVGSDFPLQLRAWVLKMARFPPVQAAPLPHTTTLLGWPNPQHPGTPGGLQLHNHWLIGRIHAYCRISQEHDDVGYLGLVCWENRRLQLQSQCTLVQKAPTPPRIAAVPLGSRQPRLRHGDELRFSVTACWPTWGLNLGLPPVNQELCQASLREVGGHSFRDRK